MAKHLRTVWLMAAIGFILCFARSVQAQINDTPLAAHEQALPQPVVMEDAERIGALSVTAGTAPGDAVYTNTINPITSVYTPGLNQRMADDMHLAASGCSVAYYEIGVVGLCNLQTCPPFDVTVALWDGDPCNPNSQMIPGTQEVFTGVPRDNIPKIGSTTFDTPIAIPDDVWMSATFSHANAGWLIAGPAEVGSTQNIFSENDTTQGCDQFFLQSNYAGFWAEIRCELAQPPLGACCNLNNCTQTTEAACTNGSWQGAFTTCVPNSCQTGTCCRGLEFDQCQSTSEAGCLDGIFTPSDTCGTEGCSPTFKVYENDFFTGVFSGVVPDTSKYGDDLTFGSGAPCDLIAYDVTVFGDPSSGPATFDATIELWTNDDNGTSTPDDDLPLAPIPGTAKTFTGIPADFFGHRLLAGAFEGIVLPAKAWVVIETSSPNAGPGLGGEADIGSSLDQFAIYNHPDEPNGWIGGFFFGGFDPDDPCPGGVEPPCPAGSFRTNVWCAGSAPTGACCDKFGGVCLDNVPLADCTGRWVEGASCADEGVFVPPCGTHACCQKFELNPNSTICINQTPEECDAAIDGFLSRGKFCEDFGGVCPAAACMGKTGDCLAPHAPPGGCEDPFCTCAVCFGPSGDEFCCDIEWDGTCVALAEIYCELQSNDICPEATAISGVGIFNFDNTDATRDGPSHEACPSPTGNEITRDVWFRWTSPCTNQVIVSSCEQTSVDTKVAVYNTVQCPVGDDDLLACNDDRCVLQSFVQFNAVTGQQYLIRVGSAPEQSGGSGTFSISCGPPNNPSCPGGTSDCCTETPGTTSCTVESCCETVCACDTFCCDTEWDSACSGVGFEAGGCGAEIVCGALCGGCPDGVVHFTNPPDGVVDARQPFNSTTGTPLQGISSVVAVGPAGADPSCFSLCETGVAGTANEIVDVIAVAGTYTITFARPITPGEVTTVTYTNGLGNTTTGEFISHPANANADATADGDDVLDLLAALGGSSLPFGIISGDMDRSGVLTPLDVLTAINLLNGAAAFEIWGGTPLPASNTCP